MLSMAAQADAFGQIGGGPAVGWIGNVFGLRVALSVGAILLSPGLVIYRRTLRRGDEAQAVQPVV
jgi:DHA3 family tetracycline resistance protein-like MFS transporter